MPLRSTLGLIAPIAPFTKQPCTSLKTSAGGPHEQLQTRLLHRHLDLSLALGVGALSRLHGLGAGMSRVQIGKKARFEIFKRDGFACQYCGATPPRALLQVDHIIPVALEGTNDSDNLITACQECNLGKGATPLEIVPQNLAQKAQETSEREAQLAGYSAVMQAKRARLDEETWTIIEIFYPKAVSAKKSELQSIKRFIEALGFHTVLDAAEAGDARFPRHNFRYFCGICWNKIRALKGEV